MGFPKLKYVKSSILQSFAQWPGMSFACYCFLILVCDDLTGEFVSGLTRDHAFPASTIQSCCGMTQQKRWSFGPIILPLCHGQSSNEVTSYFAVVFGYLF